MIVYTVVDDALSPDFLLGVELEVFIRREDAERLIGTVALRASSRVEPEVTTARDNASTAPFPVCGRLRRARSVGCTAGGRQDGEPAGAAGSHSADNRPAVLSAPFDRDRGTKAARLVTVHDTQYACHAPRASIQRHDASVQ